MTLTTSTAEASAHEEHASSVQIRVDLGEIQLSLGELAGLRAGSKLELDADLPLRCYLRIGSTTLGTGEIAHTGSGFRITLTEMIS